MWFSLRQGPTIPLSTPWRFQCAMLKRARIALVDSYPCSDGRNWSQITLCLGCSSLAGLESTRTALRKQRAFSHAAQAHKVDSYSDSLFAFAEPELPQDVTPLERAYLATEVIGVEAAMGSPQYRVASQHCSADAMQDNKLRQQCNSLAELLVTKGTNLLDLSVGRTIGARAGWPSGRVEALAQEQHALMWVGMEQVPSDNDKLWTCDAVSRLNARLVQNVQRGELGAARDLLEKSGDSVEEVAQRYTQYMDNITHVTLLRSSSGIRRRPLSK
jgi:hypothetical protein